MTALERFVSLVRRELGADDVRITDAGVPLSLAANVLSARLPDGRQVTVAFAGKPENAAALERRLEMLVRTFTQSLEEDARGRHGVRPSPARSLLDELRALSTRARAIDALVIDAKSPVVWGSAALATEAVHQKSDPLVLVDVSRTDVTAVPQSSYDLVQDTEADAERDSQERVDEESARQLSARAAAAVRALPGIGQLSKGRYLAHALREVDFGYVAHSFASIYILVLVYDAPFDEIRAERALADALPRVERLVLALPPLDPRPAPIAGVVSIRRARRR